MNILDIAIAKQLASGGGGSGTDNYNDLLNLPQINGETLAGNKSSSNLGLQDEIDSDNKLASDLVDDENQENKFVTSSEKNTWNAKQNAIDSDHKLDADLVDDSESTNKFVTASDKEAWNAKQNAIDADHKLSSSLVSFSTAEAAALASGIDSTKVGQISTNQTNILLVKDATEGLVDEGAKNIVKLYDVSEFTNIPSSLTITKNSDGSLTLNGSVSIALYSRIGEVSGNATGYSMYASTIVSDNTTIGFFYTSDNHLDSTGGSRKWHNYTSEWSTNLFLYVAANSTLNNATLYPMICLKSKYDISDNYQPPALPNYDLTQLESEDRASLAEVVDSGAKNLIPYIPSLDTETWNSTFTRTSSSVTTTATGDYGFTAFVIPNLKPGTYVLSTDIANRSGSSSTRIDVHVNASSGSVLASKSFSANGSINFEFTVNTTMNLYVMLYGSFGTFVDTTTFTANNLMLCTKAAWKISQNYVQGVLVPKIILCKDYVFTADTTLAYTGVSYVIPENTTVRITASAVSVRNQPNEIAICNNSDQNLILAHNSAVEGKTNGIITTELIYSTSNTTYTVAILAKYAGATENYVSLLVEKLN